MPDSRDHFAAYSFVDRIQAFEAGRSARATFAVPAGVPRFSSCLVAEAVGQLAAWVSMEYRDYRGRPVAALATETHFLGDASPGDTLELFVTLDHCDDETVAYGGTAHAAGRPLVALVDCLGPMLPVQDFDSPEALRARFALLCNGGAPAGRFRGVAPAPVHVVERGDGTLRARLEVPADAPFFNDHFPRRPVYPATLLLDTLIDETLAVARGASWATHARIAPTRVVNVKMRSFIAPGQALDLALDVKPPVDGLSKASMQASTDGRVVGGARLEMQVHDE